MNYKEIIESKAYDFLRTNPLLKDRLLFLVIGGSHSYYSDALKLYTGFIISKISTVSLMLSIIDCIGL